MQLVLLVITLFFVSFPSWSVETFSGYIVVNGGQRSLKVNNNNYVLVTENVDVRSQLLKLHTNDFISGLGQTVRGNVVRLETIDFVGLSRFLGVWMSSMGIFQVKDFSSLSLYSSTQPKTASSPRASLNYSITPSDGNAWGMFLTDADQIYFSNLTVTASKASIQFFDTQTGAFQKEVSLSKISR
jgi:hypothetical protein